VRWGRRMEKNRQDNAKACGADKGGEAKASSDTMYCRRWAHEEGPLPEAHYTQSHPTRSPSRLVSERSGCG
jgi:hypothetical protein